MEYSEDLVLTLPSCGGFWSFCVYHVTPWSPEPFGSGALLGETDKWVPLAPERFSSIYGVPGGIAAEVGAGFCSYD